MYKVEISTDYRSTYKTLHDPLTNDENDGLLILDGVITQAVKEIDSFTFKVYPNSDYWDYFISGQSVVYKTFLRVTNKFTDIDNNALEKVEFEGRVIGVSPAMDTDGSVYAEVVCEGVEALLLDVPIDTNSFLVPGLIVDPADRGFQSGGKDITWEVTLTENGSYKVRRFWFFSQVMNAYNAAAPSYAKITDKYSYAESMRLYDVPDGEFIYVTPTYGTDAYSILDDAVTSIFGLEVKADETGKLCVNARRFSGPLNHPEGMIYIGKNMASVSMDQDYTDVVTTMKPLGYETKTEVEYFSREDNETKTYDKATRVGLMDYLKAYDNESGTTNGGVEWLSLFGYQCDLNSGSISDTEAVKLYGKISRNVVIDGCYSERETDDGTEVYISRDDALRFFDKCMNYLQVHSGIVPSISVSAYDLTQLSASDKNDRFPNEKYSRIFLQYGLFTEVTVVNELIDLYESRYVVKRTIDLDSPQNSTVELGVPAPLETDYQKKQQTKLAKEATGYTDSSNGYTDNYSTIDKVTEPAQAETVDTPSGVLLSDLTPTQFRVIDFTHTNTMLEKLQVPSLTCYSTRLEFDASAFMERACTNCKISPDFAKNLNNMSDDEVLRLYEEGKSFIARRIPKNTSARDQYYFDINPNILKVLDLKPDTRGSINTTNTHFLKSFKWWFKFGLNNGYKTINGADYCVPTVVVEYTGWNADPKNNSYARISPTPQFMVEGLVLPGEKNENLYSYFYDFEGSGGTMDNIPTDRRFRFFIKTYYTYLTGVSENGFNPTGNLERHDIIVNYEGQ